MKKKIKMNTIESKLIAEFLGYEIFYRPYSNGFIKLSETELCDVDDLEYHTSWDALMPVVEKRESLGYVFTIQGGKAEYGEMISETQCFIAEDKLSSTYNAIIEFIKWYK